MNRFLFFICATVAMLAYGCSTKTDKNLKIDNPKNADGFQLNESLNELKNDDWNAIGMRSIKIVDSLVIIGHAGSWSLYSTEGRYYGDCLSVGQGPDEFYTLPQCSTAAYVTENDSLIAYIPDKNKGRIMRWNITAFADDSLTVITPSLYSDNLCNSVWYVVCCDAERYLESVPTDNFDGFSRVMCTANKATELEVTKTLSTARVDKEENINLLAKVFRYNAATDKVVEGMSYLNQINVFDANGKNGFTISTTNKLDDLSTIEKQHPFDRVNTYLTVTVWDKGFGAVYSGLTEKELQTDSKSYSELQIFKWDGTPVARIPMDETILAFDLDFNKGILYCVTKDDELKQYDAHSIVELL